MLDYKLIEALAMVAREGGFDKAARRLHLTQSAVSQRVKLLEEQTGQVLLARTTPPRATTAGRRMITHYLRVKRLEDDLLDAAAPSGAGAFSAMAVGINGDSLATWFFAAVRPFIETHNVLLDLRIDDQDQTQRLLKNGEVIGCISTMDQPMQGCRMDYLGQMVYRPVATPAFVAQWLPTGLDDEAARRAPFLIYNRKDELHRKLFIQHLGGVPSPLPAHYLPSSTKFVDFIAAGLAYGMLPDQQSADLMARGQLVDLAPGCQVAVKLYWHCWKLKSDLLASLTTRLVQGARGLLENPEFTEQSG
jgi:LysR family transcriptional regulator (chromosome initiation inhibitor)